MMRMLRVCTILVFLAAVVLFGMFYVQEQNSKDYTYPSIKIESETLNLSIHDTEDKFLQGVTAYDAKDGDLSSNVIVESISKFTKDRTCIVTYAVMDSDKHVVKASRTICYTDYTMPEFYLKRPLIFQVDEKVDIHEIVGAVDCMEGDISDKITIIATDYTGNTEGVFSISLQATNTLGDIIYLDIPIYVENKSALAPTIELTEHLIYVELGETPNFMDYVAGIFSDSVEVENFGMLVSSNFDCNTPGTYSIHFEVEDQNGRTGHSVLTVIVGG